MPLRPVVLICLLACALAAQARQPRSGGDDGRGSESQSSTRVADGGGNAGATAAANANPGGGAGAYVDDQANMQRRRDVLRQATRVQMEEAPTPLRQLSAQERAELRQQLQMQRLELLK